MTDIWILGAAGRIGALVSANLAASGASVVLCGRGEQDLRSLAERIGGNTRIVVTATIDDIKAKLRKAGPVVVVNLIGPFSETALPIINACAPGSRYLDLSNGRDETAGLLDLDGMAKASDRCLVSGAGWGVLAAESLVLKLCEDRPSALRVRVDLAPYIEAPGRIGETFASTIVDGMCVGAHAYKDGRLVQARLGEHSETLVAPDGSTIRTGTVSSGDLEAAVRASGAPFAVAASNMAPTTSVARSAMSAVLFLLRFRRVREFAKRRLANVVAPPPKGPVKPSWAHARVEWADGTIREGWLRAGEGMAFTSRVASEVALRLSRNEGAAGAFTPGALFGPELAEAAGAEFL